MGTHMAPQDADILMADLDQCFLNCYTQKALLYIDDTFVIRTYGKESLEKFYQNFNNFHPNINPNLEQTIPEASFSLKKLW